MRCGIRRQEDISFGLALASASLRSELTSLLIRDVGIRQEFNQSTKWHSLSRIMDTIPLEIRRILYVPVANWVLLHVAHCAKVFDGPRPTQSRHPSLKQQSAGAIFEGALA